MHTIAMLIPILKVIDKVITDSDRKVIPQRFDVYIWISDGLLIVSLAGTETDDTEFAEKETLRFSLIVAEPFCIDPFGKESNKKTKMVEMSMVGT